MVSSIKSMSESQKILFLLAFTRELSMNSGGFSLLKSLFEDSKRNEKNSEENKIRLNDVGKPEKMLNVNNEINEIELKKKFRTIPEPPEIIRKNVPMVLRIPETKLPPRFQYLKPTPTNREIDLDKLNPLIKDPIIRTIECHGPDKNIVVTGSMGVKNVNIILSKDEINDIVDRFSKATKIPVHEGVFKVVIGRLVFSAIISNVIGSKFVIKKMTYNPYFK